MRITPDNTARKTIGTKSEKIRGGFSSSSYFFHEPTLILFGIIIGLFGLFFRARLMFAFRRLNRYLAAEQLDTAQTDIASAGNNQNNQQCRCQMIPVDNRNPRN